MVKFHKEFPRVTGGHRFVCRLCDKYNNCSTCKKMVVDHCKRVHKGKIAYDDLLPVSYSHFYQNLINLFLGLGRRRRHADLRIHVRGPALGFGENAPLLARQPQGADPIRFGRAAEDCSFGDKNESQHKTLSSSNSPGKINLNLNKKNKQTNNLGCRGRRWWNGERRSTECGQGRKNSLSHMQLTCLQDAYSMYRNFRLVVVLFQSLKMAKIFDNFHKFYMVQLVL